MPEVERLKQRIVGHWLRSQLAVAPAAAGALDSDSAEDKARVISLKVMAPMGRSPASTTIA